MESAVMVEERAESVPLPETSPRKPILTSLPCPRLLAALLGAGFVYVSFYPLGLGWFSWIALVPLLFLVRARGRARNIYLAAWAGGLAFYWPVLQWMRVADYRMYFCWALLATYCSVYWPLGILLVRRLDRSTRLPLVITVPAVWVGLEYLRSFMFTGFPWYFLGHSQHAFLPLIQIADLGGVYAVSCLVAAANACIFEGLFTMPALRGLFDLEEPAFPSTRWLAPQAFTVFLVTTAVLFYGFWRLDQDQFKVGPRICLLQGNVDQRLRNDAALNPEARIKSIQQYKYLCKMAAQQQPRPDLVVWPETSLTAPWIDVSPRLPAEKLPRRWADEALESQELLQEWVKRWPANYLFGLNAFILDEDVKERRYDSALFVKADGQIGDRYDKIHRLPFGEYVPLRDWLPFMNVFAPYDYDYSIRSGDQQTRFKTGDYHYGVLICYEDTDSVLARNLVRKGADGPAVDFLVNMSNESWFDDTYEHEQHLAVCRFRAIECRRTLARAVNMGISAVIDGNGRVLKPRAVWQELAGKEDKKNATGAGENHAWEIAPDNGRFPELPPAQWARFKKVPGIVTADIPIDDRISVYAHVGDCLPVGCCLVVVGGLIAPRLSGRRRGESGRATTGAAT